VNRAARPVPPRRSGRARRRPAPAPPEPPEPPPDRRTRLLATVREQGFCTIAELSRVFGVSEMTIRRDVRLLVREGRLRAVHGGVTARPPVPGPAAAPGPGPEQAIAARVLELLPGRGAVAFDSGPLPRAVAELLPPGTPLQAVSASLPVISALSGRDGIDVIGLGGSLRRDSLDFAGPATVAAVRELRVRTLLLGAVAVTTEGVYCADHTDASVKQALLAVADEVVLLAESARFGGSALVRACALAEVDVLVTDDGLTTGYRSALRAHGVRVLTVPLPRGEPDARPDPAAVRGARGRPDELGPLG
jgi:DeoR family transcriptional regulator, aga operon transcriptional repressor